MLGMAVALTQLHCNLLLLFVLCQGGAKFTTFYQLIEEGDLLGELGQAGVVQRTFTLLYQVGDGDLTPQKFLEGGVFPDQVGQEIPVAAQPALIQPVGQSPGFGGVQIVLDDGVKELPHRLPIGKRVEILVPIVLTAIKS